MDSDSISRICKIRRMGEQNVYDLLVRFSTPVEDGEDKFTCAVQLTCKFFQKTITAEGIDGVQAFFCLIEPTKAFLDSISEDGYVLYWLEEGDLGAVNFWTYEL